jgi:hypothetical protein
MVAGVQGWRGSQFTVGEVHGWGGSWLERFRVQEVKDE